jgi:hypothetical protein
MHNHTCLPSWSGEQKIRRNEEEKNSFGAITPGQRKTKGKEKEEKFVSYSMSNFWFSSITSESLCCLLLVLF